MRRDSVVRVGAGLVVAVGLVLTTAGACGGGDDAQAPPPSMAPAPPATEVPASPQKPADGIPNNGDGDADG